MAAAEGPVRTAIEIGAGTGKATRLFAGAGVEVTAVEPDPAMLQILRRECARLPVRGIQSSYEDLDPVDLDQFDLLYAAAAMHWTEPTGRWDRAAALVRPGGLQNTISAYRQLDEDVRQTIFAELNRQLPERVVVNIDLTIHTARRA